MNVALTLVQLRLILALLYLNAKLKRSSLRRYWSRFLSSSKCSKTLHSRHRLRCCYTDQTLTTYLNGRTGAYMKFKSTTMLTAIASLAIFSSAVSAQSDYRGSDDRYADGVTIYEDCDFRGKSQTLRPGEYASLRQTGFGNDRVSSIRVPRGIEAVIYRDDDFRGSYARIDRDIACFDRKWNDEASSISVRELGYNQRQDDRYDRRDNGQRYEGRDYDNRGRDSNRRGNNGLTSSSVTAKNVSRVTFDGASLQQVAKKQWSYDRRRGNSTQFDEVGRDRDSVYLKNKYTAETIRIDLFANDVTVVSRDGRRQRFNIDGKNAAEVHNNRGRRNNQSVTSSPSRVFSSSCFNYRAYAKNGSGSVRFYTSNPKLVQFDNRPVTGRICHNGGLGMEIGKLDKNIDVVVELDGRPFRFAPQEKESSYLNNWYRKSVQLVVGK